MWRTTLGSLCGAVAVLAVSVNAMYMLVSPRSWFRLPGWIRLNGTLTEKRYGIGWGALQVRILGAILLITLGWIAFHFFSK